MSNFLLLIALLTHMSAMAAQPIAEEMLAENNFHIVSDMYDERPVWIKSYHCDSATIVRTLMNNPQVIIEREFEGRLICRMCDVQVVREDDVWSSLPSYMRWTATLYFTVEIASDSYEVELREAVWNGVKEQLDDPTAVSHTLHSIFYNNNGKLDKNFAKYKSEDFNDRLTAIFAPRL